MSMSHRLKQPWRTRLQALSPLGLGNEDKPKHYREALNALSQNRDNLRYALKVLRRGICDSCALGVAGFHDWTIGEPHICMKRMHMLRLNTIEPLNHKFLHGVSDISLMTNEELLRLGRLAYPMRRRRGEPGFTRISWEDAYQRIADQVRETEPQRLAFFLGGRGLSNEAYYLAQKVARFFGTNNIDTAGRLAFGPGRAAMRHALGVASATCSYSDMWDSDLVVFFNSRPATDQPVMTNYLLGARRSGARTVMVCPELERDMYRYWVPSRTRSALFGSKMTDYWFPVTPEATAAFLQGVVRVMIEQDWCDANFIDTHTDGFDALKQELLAMDWSAIEEEAGIERAAMAEFAELLHKAKRAVFVWPLGSPQQELNVAAAQMIVNLALSKGYLGRTGCGLLPMPAHTNLLGAADMGAYANGLPGDRPLTAANLEELSTHWGFQVPRTPGMSAADMVEAARRDELSMLYCTGGNFLAAEPDPEYVRHAMERLPLRIHQDTMLTEQMFIEPKRDDGEVLLLPAKTIYEQKEGATQTSAERRVMFSPEIPREVGETHSHWRIFLQVAATVDAKRAVDLECTTGDAIREEIARILPEYHGIQYLQNVGDAFQSRGRRLCEEWRFPTPTGRARFLASALPKPQRKRGWFDARAVPDDPQAPPDAQAPSDAILLNADDVSAMHLKRGDRVALVSEAGRCEGRIWPSAIPRGSVQLHGTQAQQLGANPHIAVQLKAPRQSVSHTSAESI
ncbi:MAG: molybdopterin-dependent oxidoreductase [Phycisphaeraceae bacterium]